MAELKKAIVAKVAEVKDDIKKEAPKAAPAAEKKEAEKKAAPAKKAAAKPAAKKAPAKKAAAKPAAEKKAAPAKKAEAKPVAEKKAAPAKKAAAKPAAKKAPAKKVVAKETLAVQFAGKDYSTEAIMKLVKDAYKATKNKAAIVSLDVYVNTDDSRAYYVVNGEFHGSVEV